jgi:hypothetical protein
MSASRWLTGCAVLAVLVVYAFIGSDGRFTFPLVPWTRSYYGSLAEGFLRGQLSMAHEPPPALRQVHDPYSQEARRAANVRVLWDASYFEGKYYLYFSPVPALLFYIPVRLVTGGYPSDALATALFTSIGFILFVLTLGRALPRPQVPLWFWALVAGVGNIIPYLLVRPLMYEVAISCAMTFTAGFAYALLRFVETKTAGSALATGACLAMAIASRPNLGVLLVASAVAVVLVRRHLLLLLAPLVLVGSGVMLYNQARFHSPFDFGICHQLNVARTDDCAQCGVRNGDEALRMANGVMHYVFWAPAIHSRFPYLEVQKSRLDSSVSYLGRPEPVSGIATVTPLVLVGSAFAAILVLRRKPLEMATRTGTILVASGWLVLFGLASCRWTTARFTLEFAGLMIVGGVICTEAGLLFLEEAGVATRPLRSLIVAMCTLSIAAGLLLPFGRPPWL